MEMSCHQSAELADRARAVAAAALAGAPWLHQQEASRLAERSRSRDNYRRRRKSSDRLYYNIINSSLTIDRVPLIDSDSHP
jgi:hypothetical protein